MAYTYLTLGSWELDTDTVSALMDRAENGKRKNIFFFFPQPLLLSCFTASDESSLS